MEKQSTGDRWVEEIIEQRERELADLREQLTALDSGRYTPFEGPTMTYTTNETREYLEEKIKEREEALEVMKSRRQRAVIIMASCSR